MSLPTTVGIASSLVSSCLSHLSKASNSRATSKETNYRASLNHEFGRFRLWAHGFGHSNNDWKVDNDPLDEVLERSKYLKEPTILLLSSFASCLLMKHFKQIGDDTTRTALENKLQEAIIIYPHIEDDCCGTGSDQSQKSAVEELHDIVDSLFELAPPLNEVLENLRPPTDPNLHPIKDSYKNLIRDKFPNARQHLVLRFAEGNTECYTKLIAQAERRSIPGPEPSVPIQIIGNQCSDRPNLIAPSEIVSHAQLASFHDSGLGSSRPSDPSNITSRVERPPLQESPFALVPPPSVSCLSESTIFSLASALDNRASIPSMPKDSRSRNGFNCTVCHRLQKPISKNRQWRKHIFSDLEPYMCIHEDCTGTESFQSKGEWIAHHNSHKQFDHDSRLGIETCPFCLKEFTSDQTKFNSHVGHHMEDIRLFTLPPSYRQLDGLEAFDNSSGTQGSETAGSSRRGELSVIPEEGSPQTATANAFREKLKAYNTPNKYKFLDNWFSSGEVAGQRLDTVTKSTVAGHPTTGTPVITNSGVTNPAVGKPTNPSPLSNAISPWETAPAELQPEEVQFLDTLDDLKAAKKRFDDTMKALDAAKGERDKRFRGETDQH